MDVSRSGERSRVSCLSVSSVTGSLENVCEVNNNTTGCAWCLWEDVTMSSENLLQLFVIQMMYCLCVAAISVELL